MKTCLSLVLTLFLIMSMAGNALAAETMTVAEYAAGTDNATIDAGIYLDYAAGIAAGVYKWVLSDDETYYTLCAVDEAGEPLTAQETAINVGANNEERGGFKGEAMPEGGFPGKGEGKHEGGMRGGMMGGFGGGGTVYQGVYMNANITNLENQTMLVYVPAAYMETDDTGAVVGINHNATVNGYTADTAPIVYLNECGGWKSSSPRSVDASYIEQGFVYVTAGARSRDAVDDTGLHTGKAPTQVVDLKSGVIALRANDAVIPGDKDKIISVGTSGGGQIPCKIR